MYVMPFSTQQVDSLSGRSFSRGRVISSQANFFRMVQLGVRFFF